MDAPSIEQFPTTPEDFDNTYVLPNRLVRFGMVKWFKGLFDEYIDHDSLDREKLLYYLTTMTSSLKNTTHLYKIQIADNIKVGKPPQVATDNLYYGKLLKSHQLWTKVAQQIEIIFNYSYLKDYNYDFNLFQETDAAISVEVIRGFLLNWYLPGVMKELEDSSNEIFADIEKSKAL